MACTICSNHEMIETKNGKLILAVDVSKEDKKLGVGAWFGSEELIALDMEIKYCPFCGTDLEEKDGR